MAQHEASEGKNVRLLPSSPFWPGEVPITVTQLSRPPTTGMPGLRPLFDSSCFTRHGPFSRNRRRSHLWTYTELLPELLPSPRPKPRHLLSAFLFRWRGPLGAPPTGPSVDNACQWKLGQGPEPAIKYPRAISCSSASNSEQLPLDASEGHPDGRLHYTFKTRRPLIEFHQFLIL